MPERLSASVAARHMSCHASADLPVAIPNYVAPVEDRTAATAANAGTAKHEMLEPIMELSGTEILGMAKYLTYVGELRLTRRFNVLVEKPMQAMWLATQPETKADLVLYTQDEMHILDGKWGKIPVEVVENEQLLYYAATYGALAPKAKGVTLHVLQPAIGEFNSWFADTNRIGQFMAEVQAAESAIQRGDTTFGPSDHCMFCPANPHGRGLKGRPFCPVMMDLLYPDRVDEDAILAL